MVPGKRENSPHEDPVEGRGAPGQDPMEGKMTGISSPETVSTKLSRIAELARTMPGKALHSLSRHIDVEWLKEAYRRTRKGGAVGVDGQTAKDYECKLEENLRSLLDRFKSGEYRAPPVRRVLIPKDDGKTRPIGIPAFEDKVLQRAVAMILEAIYEQDFLDCSYAFRPKRSAHMALDTLWKRLMDIGGGWVLEVDIKAFFDTLVHKHLRVFLDQRVRDGVLCRTIDKWLSAGVMEDGSVSFPEDGTPQGGVVSPILANLYLHEVLDLWFAREVQPRLRGQAHLIRFADDAVLVFELEGDARRVLNVLPKRFEKYGLTLHPTKTRLIPFVRPPRTPVAQAPGDPKRPGTFDLLGFNHHWAQSRARKWIVVRETCQARFKRAATRIDDWCRANRHLPVKQQRKTLALKLNGHCQYYGITGNSRALVRFRYALIKSWQRWLDRRSQKRKMPWHRFNQLLQVHQIPAARAVHSLLRRGANV